MAVRGNVHGGKLVAPAASAAGKRCHRSSSKPSHCRSSSPPSRAAASALFFASATLRRPSPVAFMKPGNSMTVPDAWNMSPRRVGRSARTAHGGGGTGGIGHLAGQRALPDQRVQLELVGRQLWWRAQRGIAEVRARRANTLVGFLRARGLRGVLLGRIGQVLFAEVPRHRSRGRLRSPHATASPSRCAYR
jgi:hypothetical protein